MLSRGLIPINNIGDGNCVFISLSQILLGDTDKFEFMRYMIVYWLKSFPDKYKYSHKKNKEYCNVMAMNGRAANMVEL